MLWDCGLICEAGRERPQTQEEQAISRQEGLEVAFYNVRITMSDLFSKVLKHRFRTSLLEFG